MDKSVNNFDDVDDTMSSVYNAWRKKISTESFDGHSRKGKKNRNLAVSISLTRTFGHFFAVFALSFRNLLNLDNF